MSTNGISTPVPVRRRLHVSSWAVRLLIAFVISWLIILAFFVSGAVSR